MKTEIICESTQEKEIDWSKVSILKSNVDGLIILTDGQDNNGDNFTGTVIVDGKCNYLVGCILHSWRKECFDLIQKPITIKFSND
jgi:hypothetical protein